MMQFSLYVSLHAYHVFSSVKSMFASLRDLFICLVSCGFGELMFSCLNNSLKMLLKHYLLKVLMFYYCFFLLQNIGQTSAIGGLALSKIGHRPKNMASVGLYSLDHWIQRNSQPWRLFKLP